MQLERDCIELLIIVSASQLQLVAQGGGRHSCAHIPEIGMSMGNSAILSITLFMGAVTIVMLVLGAKTPVARLPEGTLLLNMVGTRLVAFEAIGELGFASSTSLA